MNLHCDTCGHKDICVCHLPDDSTEGAMEILCAARALVIKVAEVIPPPFQTRHYIAATRLSHALLHVAGFTGPVGA